MAAQKAPVDSMKRYWVPQYTVELDTAGPPVNASPIPYGQFAAGRVIVGADIASVTLTWWECATKDGTYVQVYSGGAAVTSTLPGGAASCEIPAACAGCAFLKIQSNADDEETVTVIKKA